jgi:quercetin dioxygenase-like cupin family protein
MELILVTEGETQMTIDGKEYTGNAGDLYVVESNVMHVIANASDKPCSYFAIRFQ